MRPIVDATFLTWRPDPATAKRTPLKCCAASILGRAQRRSFSHGCTGPMRHRTIFEEPQTDPGTNLGYASSSAKVAAKAASHPHCRASLHMECDSSRPGRPRLDPGREVTARWNGDLKWTASQPCFWLGAKLDSGVRLIKSPGFAEKGQPSHAVEMLSVFSRNVAKKAMIDNVFSAVSVI